MLQTKKSAYFYSYEDSLTDYHKKRLSNFGEVPINFLEKENQLYFSYTLGYIASKVLEIETFKSKTCKLSNKFKLLAKENKVLTDEIIKALIVDEGWIEDKIKVELANKELVKGLYEIISHHYMLAKLISRERHNISFKGLWNHDLSVWGFEFSAKSFQDLHKSISPLPIDYKQEALDFLYERQTRGYNQRKSNETKKLIIRSLLENSKTIGELAKELLVKQTTIRAHLKGHPSYREALIKLGIADRIGEKILRRGGFTRVGIYGIKNKKKAIDYLLL